MKILQLTNKNPWPPKDGGAIATLNLTKGFSLLGHQVTVLSMNTAKHFISKDEIPENLKALVKFQLVDVEAPVSNWAAIRNLLFSKLPYNAERFISEDYSRSLMKLLKKKNLTLFNWKGFTYAHILLLSGDIL